MALRALPVLLLSTHAVSLNVFFFPLLAKLFVFEIPKAAKLIYNGPYDCLMLRSVASPLS